MLESGFDYVGERFADLQMLRYRLPYFERLSTRQKKYIYCLSKAALMGRDITTDQYGRYNIVIRKVLERVFVGYHGNRDSDDFSQMTLYLKRVWFSNGIYHHYGCEKFVPGFSEQWFRKAVWDTLKDMPSCKGEPFQFTLDDVCRVMFNPEVLPFRVNQTIGEDLVKTSACSFYENVSQEEATRFYDDMRAQAGSDECPSFGLNSRLVKKDGMLAEQKYTANGLYGSAIRNIVFWLGKARNFVENTRQDKVISLLVDYYQTGDLKTFDAYSIEWLKEQQGDVDFINGFIEVYGDPLGLKGTWEGLVEYKDAEATRRTQKIADNAQWFEDHSPVDDRFKKTRVKGVSAKAISAAMLGGEEYPSSAIGINLPNADWIRARHGSKSVTIGNLTSAYDHAAQGSGLNEEFVIDSHTRHLIVEYGNLCDELHTDLHECLGHGSGRLLPGVSSDALGTYGSTIEEARADLFALYYLADRKLLDLGLLKHEEAYKSGYYHYMMNGLLTQLARIKPGHKIEEAHMRNRALIARWCLDKGKDVVQLVKKNGKTYLYISDYGKLRQLFAALLAEIQRIKSEGDRDAARCLVEKYAVNVDLDLHEEVLARYEKLHLAPYKGFLNPRLIPVKDEQGNTVDIKLDYSESYEQQMLRYSSEYATL